MLIRQFDRWMSERSLWIEIGEPFYTATLFGPDGPLLGVEAPTLAELAQETIAASDALQRQRGERWALTPNPLLRTFEELDRRLEDEGRYLVLERFTSLDKKYRAFTVDFAGDRSESATGPNVATAVDLALLAVHIPAVGAAAAMAGDLGREGQEARVRGGEVRIGRGRPGAFEDDELVAALDEHGGSVAEAARALKAPYTTVLRRTKELAMPPAVQLGAKRALTRAEAEHAIEEHGSISKAAASLGVARSTVRLALER
jgi:hypothetical protein